MQTNLEFIQSVIDRLDISDDDKRLLKTTLWTSDEVPSITSHQQYEAYARLKAELSRALPDRVDPNFDQAFVEWTRSREGILAITYGAKMAEWEERQTP